MNKERRDEPGRMFANISSLFDRCGRHPERCETSLFIKNTFYYENDRSIDLLSFILVPW